MSGRRQLPEAVGPWKITGFIGEGGNAIVYRATRGENPDGEVALKVLKSARADSENYRRFQREVSVVENELSEIGGVLPILDYDLPDRPGRRNRPWIAMPIATPLNVTLKEASLAERVQALAAIARTLAEIAERGVAHRDIKPGNLFFKDDMPLVGDFGLVETPGDETSALTRAGRPLGPVHFAPYELLSDPLGADGLRADVYMMGKTIWVILTGALVPPPGPQQADNHPHTIVDYTGDTTAGALDRLVERATRGEPGDRPTMAKLASELGEWLRADEVADSEPPNIDDLVARYRRAAAGQIREDERREAQLHRFDDLVELLTYAAAPILEQMQRVIPSARAGTYPGPRSPLEQLYETGFGEPQLVAEHEQWYSMLPRESEVMAPYATLGWRLELRDDGQVNVQWGSEVGALGVADVSPDYHPARTAGIEDQAAERICRETAEAMIASLQELVSALVDRVEAEASDDA